MMMPPGNTQASHAQVTVLTAEVKALMVGSRQVTRSVFRQLDEVDYGECMPMGRVNEPGGRWIVGADDNGVLVRARFDWEFPRLDIDERAELNRLLSWQAPLSEQQKTRLAELQDIAAKMPLWRQEWEAELTRYNALPLIVLAGLR